MPGHIPDRSPYRLIEDKPFPAFLENRFGTEAIDIQPSAYSLLPTAFYLQPSAYSLLPTAFYLQPSAAPLMPSS
ncbi:MAG: hypothetical protein NUK54_03940 [Methanothrix sp.]|nr:hypothetical protein [Methanothrix sp.]